MAMLRNRRFARRNVFADEYDPMSGLANLVDVILVFACGLMIAIVTFWNVDLSKVQDIIDESELKEVTDVEQAIEDGEISETLENQGSAYKDPETGKIYVIMPGK